MDLTNNDRKWLNVLKYTLELLHNVEKLHAPSDDGEICQYCEDNYPCRTIRVLQGTEQVLDFPELELPELPTAGELWEKVETISKPHKINPAFAVSEPNPKNKYKKIVWSDSDRHFNTNRREPWDQ